MGELSALDVASIRHMVTVFFYYLCIYSALLCRDNERRTHNKLSQGSLLECLYSQTQTWSEGQSRSLVNEHNAGALEWGKEVFKGKSVPHHAHMNPCMWLKSDRTNNQKV